MLQRISLSLIGLVIVSAVVGSAADRDPPTLESLDARLTGLETRVQALESGGGREIIQVTKDALSKITGALRIDVPEGADEIAGRDWLRQQGSPAAEGDYLIVNLHNDSGWWLESIMIHLVVRDKEQKVLVDRKYRLAPQNEIAPYSDATIQQRVTLGIDDMSDKKSEWTILSAEGRPPLDRKDDAPAP